MKIPTFLLSVLLFSASAHASGINLIANGDFSAGDVGFSKDYVCKAPGLGPMSLWDPGTCTVDTSALNNHGLWETGGDHTTGTGNFLLLNGYTDPSLSLAWGETLALAPGQYLFSMFAKNLCCAGVTGVLGPSLDFYLDNLLVGAIQTDGPSVWLETQFAINVSNPLSMFSILNTDIAYGGNDYGLDDITLKPVPEPASMLLLGMGLFLVVSAANRKKSS